MLTSEEKLKRNYIQLVEFARTELTTSKLPNSNACIAWQTEPTLCKSYTYSSLVPKAVASHVIAKNMLKHIANAKGEVSSIELKAPKGIKEGNPYELSDTHINNFSTFYGFCEKCEGYFKNIDEEPLNKDTFFKYIYRDLGKRIIFLRSELERMHTHRHQFLDVLRDYESKEPELDLDELICRHTSLLHAYKIAFINCSNSTNIKDEFRTNERLYDITTMVLSRELICLGLGMHTNVRIYKDVGLVNMFSFVLFHNDSEDQQCVTVIEPKSLNKDMRVLSQNLIALSKTNKPFVLNKFIEKALSDPLNTMAFKVGYIR